MESLHQLGSAQPKFYVRLNLPFQAFESTYLYQAAWLAQVVVDKKVLPGMPAAATTATAALAAAKQPAPWPYLGKTETNITAHAHQLAKDATALLGAIQDRQKGSTNVPSSKLLPLCASIQSLVEKFLSQTGVPAWETHLNEINQSQQIQAKQIDALTKAVNTVATAYTAPGNSQGNGNGNDTSTFGSSRVRSWAQVAIGADPPLATKSIRTWTSSTGSTYPEYVTSPQEREIIIKLHGSSRDEGTAVKSWIQGMMPNNPRALIDHINKAIQLAAKEGQPATTLEPPGSPGQNTLRANTTTTGTKPYEGIQVASAIFMKSGDIQIHTTFVSQAKILLAHADEWAKYVGNRAKAVIPTYGVVIHAIPTVSFDPTRPKDMATQLQTLNAGHIQHDTITYMGWLTKEGAAKAISSIVVEFTAPEPANKLIHASCLWSNETHMVEKYDRTCRIKQCLRCQKYGHITTQCAAVHDYCGYCGDSHDTRRCSVRTSSSGGIPKCIHCKQQHPAWSNKCEYRKRERQRVEQALKNKTKYWPETISPATPTPILIPAPIPTTLPVVTLEPGPIDLPLTAKRRGRPLGQGNHSKAGKPPGTKDDLLNTAPRVSLAEGPVSSSITSRARRQPMSGITPGKPKEIPGTIRPIPKRKALSRVQPRSTRHSRATGVESADDADDTNDVTEILDSIHVAGESDDQSDEQADGQADEPEAIYITPDTPADGQSDSNFSDNE